MMSSALNLASSSSVILATRMVFTATSCLPLRVALYTVPNLCCTNTRSESICGESDERVGAEGVLKEHVFCLRPFAELAPVLHTVFAKNDVAVV